MGKSENLGSWLYLELGIDVQLQIYKLPLKMSSQSGSEFVEYDSECYEVECIRDRRIFKGKKQYFIKWKDWEQKYNTWQPIQNLQTVLKMVNEFQIQFGTKKDSNLKQSQTNEAALKKTKPIEKQKKKRKNNEEIEPSQSEEDVVQIVQMKEKKGKKDEKKEGKKSTSISNNNEMQMEKQKGGDKVLAKEKEVERQKVGKDMKQKQKERQKQKQKQVPIIKKSESSSIANINKAPQSSAPVNLPKQASKSASEPYSGDIIEITGINYHILIPPELPHLPAKLYYNVDRRNKITKKPLAVIDVPSQELLHKCPQMIIKHLQRFAVEVQFYSYQRKQYQNLQNLQNKAQNSSVLTQK